MKESKVQKVKTNVKQVKLPVITVDIAKQLWALEGVQLKKSLILNYMGEAFNTKAQGAIRKRIQNAKTSEEIDIIVTNMMMKTSGHGVI